MPPVRSNTLGGKSMKWFKHAVDAHDGRTIQKIIKKFGLEGEARYWRLIAICSQKFVEKDQMIAFDSDFIRRSLRHRSLTDCRSFVEWLTTAQIIDSDLSGIGWLIKIPNILEIRDNHTRNLQVANKKLTSDLPLDKEKELDKESDKELELNNITSEPKSLIPRKSKIELKVFENKKIEVSEELMQSWANTYPREYLEESFKQARNWLLANEHKAPKKNFGRFFNSWFDRGWERYRKTLTTKNNNKITSDDLRKMLEDESE